VNLQKLHIALSCLSNRRLGQMDICIFLLAPLLAILLRLEHLSDIHLWLHWGLGLTILCFISIKFALLRCFSFYRYCWRFASTDELMLIAGLAFAAAVLNSICLHFLDTWLPLPDLPRSLPILDAILSFIGIGLVRFSIRFVETTYQRSQVSTAGKRLLIVGAGSAGVALAADMQRHPNFDYQPVAFIDDDPLKKGLKVRNIPIVGNHYQIPDIVKSLDIHRVIIAMPSVAGQVIREVVEICKAIGVKTSTLPGLHEILSDRVRLGSIRDVNIEDLLRREPIQTNVQAVVHLLKGKTVLITGAGGSIGSELCRQIYRGSPATMILMGHGENSVFNIQQELEHFAQILKQDEGDSQTSPRLIVLIADLRSFSRLNYLFSQYKPDIVFHAAAHKHVPLMELNPPEAITNNVLGTKNLLDLSIQYQVKHFVMISSDKAVNPTNVMGASKRVAEMLVLQAAKTTGRHYAVVRFGNVLGSRGSVVPTFQRQIAKGGPVKITHPDICRYFITIPEAVQIVLQASILSGGGGEIFMLNMGQPVKIIDLATDLIRLSGYEVGKDIEIVFTGLRPGEKLYEELLLPGEEYKPTEHQKILVVNNAFGMVPENLDAMINALYAAAAHNEHHLILLLLEQLVVGYQPNYPEGNFITSIQSKVKQELSRTTLKFEKNNKALRVVSKKPNKIEIEQRLQQVLAREEFCLYYQPIFQLERSRLIGFEALLRWHDPQWGVILPRKFIFLAEKMGALSAISFWVIHEVCRQLSVWQENHSQGQSLTIDINIPHRELLQPNLVKHIQENLQKNLLDPYCLRLEIAESAIANDFSSAMPVISELKALGVQLQIDNFGKTCSANHYFDSFPNFVYKEFDRLKLDRHAIARISKDQESLETLRSITTNARNSGIEVIAAGVETPEQLAHLISMQCKYGQGFLFSEPLEGENAKMLIGKQLEFVSSINKNSWMQERSS
jgi:FlaA1/EpsC-like NDP-sugar epimerase/EAL domain-containing protein (putative c-di-GMP-specific phosphodiesterase class I)